MDKEADIVGHLLRDKKNMMYLSQQKKEESSGVKALEKKLDQSVKPRNTMDSSNANWGHFFRSTMRDKSHFGFRKGKSHQRSQSKKTLEIYYNQRKMESRLTVQTPDVSRNSQVTPRRSECLTGKVSFHQNKSGNFRIMMKQMREKLSRSKNCDSRWLIDDQEASGTRSTNNPSTTLSKLDEQIV